MGSLFGGGSSTPAQPIDPPERSVSGTNLTEEGFDPLKGEKEVDTKRALSKPTGVSQPRVDTTTVV